MLPVLIAIGVLLALLAWSLDWRTGEPGGSVRPAIRSEAVGEAASEDPALPAAGGRALAEEPAPVLDPRAGNVDLAAAAWVEGRVRLPEGCPADESIELLLVVGFEGDRAVLFESDAATHASLDEWLGLLDSTGAAHTWSRRAVELDGTFRLPRPARAERIWILMGGRWVFLEEPYRRDSRDVPDPLVLEPVLGGRIVGTLAPRGKARDRAARLAGTARVRVTLSDYDPELFDQIERPVDAELRFAFGPLPAGLEYDLWTDVVEGLSSDVEGTVVHAGQETNVRIHVRGGARVTGRVVDFAGAPFAGARVTWAGTYTSSSRMDTSEDAALTGPDGSFVLDPVVPAEHFIVWAAAEGHDSKGCEPFALLAGDEHAGVELVLSRGSSVTGAVLWSDGRPAADVSVRISGRDEDVARGVGFGGPVEFAQRTRTDDQGEFALTIPTVSERESAVVTALAPVAGVEDAEDAAPRARAQITVGSDTLEGVELVLGDTVALAGRVVDESGRPIPRFDVELEWQGRFEPGRVQARVAREFETSDGSFLLGDLAAGPYSIAVGARGFQESSRSVKLGGGGEAGEQVFTLTASAAVSGVVLDPAGGPVPGAEVHGLLRWPVEADEVGRFSYWVRPEVALHLHADAADWAPGPVEIVPPLDPGEEHEGIVLRLVAGGWIAGEVLDERGRPWPNCEIHCSPLGDGPDRSTESDAAGTFTLGPLASGEYAIACWPSGNALDAPGELDPASALAAVRTAEVEVRAGEKVRVVLGGILEEAVDVSGRVTAAGLPVEGAKLLAFPEGPGLVEAVRLTVTGAHGGFALTLARPGPVVFVLEGPANSSSASGPRGVWTFDVPRGGAADLQLVLPEGRLVVRVHAPEGEPSSSAAVFVQAARALEVPVPGFGSRSALADSADHGVEFLHLAPGRYIVRAGAGRSYGTAEVEVPADGVPAEVELSLAPTGGLAGSLTDAAGAPVAGALVFVRDAEGRLVEPEPSTRTDARGRFALAGLPAGALTVCARTGSQCSGRATVEVVPGEESDVALGLEAATLLTLCALEPGGQPVRASFSVKDAEGREMVHVLAAGGLEGLSGGGLAPRCRRVGPLAPGRYSIKARTAEGLERERTVRLTGAPERTVQIRLRR